MLITEIGPEVRSSGAAKEMADVEELVGSAK